MSAAIGESRGRWPVGLRRTDQVCCVGVIVLSLAWMGASWIHHGGLQGRLIDVDRAERKNLSFQLDINHADWPEWSVLPGIGETLAKRILQARKERGPFRRHEDLLHVHGIGPKTLDRIRPYLLPMPDGPRS